MRVNSSPSGPRASALTPTTVCDRSGIFASTFDNRSPCCPAKLPLAPRTCIEDRSKINSPPSSVNAGHGSTLAGCNCGGT